MAALEKRRGRILLATTGSASARQAASVAAELAVAQGAELIVVHVVPAAEYRFARFGPLDPVPRRLDDPLGDRALLDARRVAWERGAPVRLLLLSGDAREVIVRVADGLSVDLLVVDWHRQPVLSRGLTRWVVTRAPCPVLAVTLPGPAHGHRRRHGRAAASPSVCTPAHRL